MAPGPEKPSGYSLMLALVSDVLECYKAQKEYAESIDINSVYHFRNSYVERLVMVDTHTEAKIRTRAIVRNVRHNAGSYVYLIRIPFITVAYEKYNVVGIKVPEVLPEVLYVDYTESECLTYVSPEEYPLYVGWAVLMPRFVNLLEGLKTDAKKEPVH